MKYKITINQKVYEVEVEKGDATLLSEYEAAVPIVAPEGETKSIKKEAVEKNSNPTTMSVDGNAVLAPLPGTVIDVLVSIGDIVNNGDVVAIIEAMKMENEVIAVISGTVTSVMTEKGATIETGAPVVILR